MPQALRTQPLPLAACGASRDDARSCLGMPGAGPYTVATARPDASRSVRGQTLERIASEKTAFPAKPPVHSATNCIMPAKALRRSGRSGKHCANRTRQPSVLPLRRKSSHGAPWLARSRTNPMTARPAMTVCLETGKRHELPENSEMPLCRQDVAEHCRAAHPPLLSPLKPSWVGRRAALDLPVRAT